MHRDRKVITNNTEYSTTLFTTEAENVIATHAKESPDTPLFLYLPYQAVHVGNKPTQEHPEYALDQAPQNYINEYSWVADEQRRNLSAMVTVMVRVFNLLYCLASTRDVYVSPICNGYCDGTCC